MAAEDLTTPAQLLQKLVTTSAGAVLAVIIVWSVSKLADVDSRMNVMESRSYPPRYITEAIQAMQTEQRRLQTQIDRLERYHPGITVKPLDPYSFHGIIDEEEQGG